MAKKRAAGDVNKSAAIREYLAENPQAGPKTITADLGKQGIAVSESLASVVKYKSGRKKTATAKRQDRPRKVGPTRRAPQRATRTGGNGPKADDLFEAKKLAERVGGIAEARKALETLEQLQ